MDEKRNQEQITIVVKHIVPKREECWTCNGDGVVHGWGWRNGRQMCGVWTCDVCDGNRWMYEGEQ